MIFFSKMYLLTEGNIDLKLHSIWPRHLLRSGLFRVTVSLFISMDVFRCAILRRYLDWRKVMFLGLVIVTMWSSYLWHLSQEAMDPWNPHLPSQRIVFGPLNFALGHFQHSLLSHRAMERSLKLNGHCPPPTLPNRAVSQMCYIQMNLAFSVPIAIFPSLMWQVTHLNLLPSFSPLPTIRQEHLGRSPTSQLSDSSFPMVSTIASSCHSLLPIILGNVIYREGERESHQHSYKTLLL